jgi:hypothetical protein
MTGEYPSEWNTGIIIPFPKKQVDYPKINEFRPITLLSVVAKGLEKIVLKRLQKLNTKYNLIPPNQWGFLKGRSTYENLSILYDKTQRGMTNKNIVSLAFLDLSKAYDRVNRKLLIRMLKKKNFKGNILRYLSQFIGKREAKTRYGKSTSDKMEMKNGVVQGSALSPNSLTCIRAT